MHLHLVTLRGGAAVTIPGDAIRRAFVAGGVTGPCSQEQGICSSFRPLPYAAQRHRRGGDEFSRPRQRAWRAAHRQHAGVDAAGGQDGAGHIFTIVQDVIGRGACSRVAFARARQRARGQRTRLAAPEQRGHFFNSFFKLSTISFYMGQQLEIFGLLLLLPRARRALARAETRAHTAAAHARALRRPQARVWPMCRVLLYVWYCRGAMLVYFHRRAITT